MPPHYAQARSAEDSIAITNQAHFKNIAFPPGELASRLYHGTKGQAIELYANYLELELDKTKISYMYSVAISPVVNGRKKRRVCQLLRKQLQSQTGSEVATDLDSWIVTVKELDFPEGESREFEVPFKFDYESTANPKKDPFTVTLTSKGNVPISLLLNYLSSTQLGATFPQKTETIAALNLLVTHTANSRSGITHGNKKFYQYPLSPQSNAKDLGTSLLALRGFFTSVRTSTLRPLININVGTSAFYPTGNLAELMVKKESIDRRNVNSSFVHNLRIHTCYLKNKDTGEIVKKRKKLTGFHRSNAEDTLFETPAGDSISVKKHYGNILGRALKYPKLPLVKAGIMKIKTAKDGEDTGKPKDVDDQASVQTKPVLLPPEVCYIEPNQMYRAKLSPVETKEMIKLAVRPPAENARQIMQEGIGLLGISENNPRLVG